MQLNTAITELYLVDVAGLPIDDQGELLGETDNSSFGFGKAPSSAKAAHSSVVNARKREVRRNKKDVRGSGNR